LDNSFKESPNSKTSIAERTFNFALEVVKFGNFVESGSSSAKVLVKQLIRAGTSIGADIEEAQAAESQADFTHKYNMALKEARETRYWLHILLASDTTILAQGEKLLKESEEISQIISEIVASVRQNK
jgi:four helix bundle protein